MSKCQQRKGDEIRVKTRVNVIYGSSLSSVVVNKGSSRSCSSNSSHSSSLPSDNLAPYSAVYISMVKIGYTCWARKSRYSCASSATSPVSSVSLHESPSFHSSSPSVNTLSLSSPRSLASSRPKVNYFQVGHTFHSFRKTLKKFQHGLEKICQRSILLERMRYVLRRKLDNLH